MTAHHRGVPTRVDETVEPLTCFEPQGLSLWNGTKGTSSEGACVLSLGVQWALHKLTRCQHSPGSDVGLASTRRSGRALSMWLPQRSLGATMVPLQAPEALVPGSTQ